MKNNLNNKKFQHYLSRYAGSGCKSIIFILMALVMSALVFGGGRAFLQSQEVILKEQVYKGAVIHVYLW